jgi:tripartite-type tricarboxylate transporter receptor subunit TctC
LLTLAKAVSFVRTVDYGAWHATLQRITLSGSSPVEEAPVRRATFIVLVACGLAALPCAGADPYPAKVIRIVTVAAGGGSDFASRLIATPLGASLGQQVIVDNRGQLAIDIAAKAPADGYTLLLSGPALWLLPFMRDNVAASMQDFTPVTMATQTVNVLVVHPALPVKSVDALIALAKARPGQLNFATSGNGNTVHIAGELFKSMSGCDIVRINYKGAGQALTDLVAGQTQLMFAVPGSAMPHVKSGRLRALAVTSAEPSPLLPGLPTVAARLPGYESVSYLAVVAPNGTPAAIVTKLQQEIARALARPEVKEKLVSTGIETMGTAPEVTAALIKAETARMGKVIRAANIRAD